jgi:hypothetical protein
MANELALLPNPDNIPGAVSTGYQRQNTNLFAVQTGHDTLNPINNGSSVTIQAGGLIEVNGSLFKVITNVTLSKSANSISWVAVTDNGDGTASFSLSSSQGTWNQAKQGYYLPNGARTSKWDTSGVPSGSGGVLAYSKSTKGSELISLPEGKYRAVLRSGKGNGNASGASGGVASSYHEITVYFYHDGNRQLQIRVGGNGFNGGNGGNGVKGGSPGGGGGSGAGEETEICGIAKTLTIPAGRSNNGCMEGTPGLGGDGGSNDGLPGTSSSSNGYGSGGNGGNGSATSGGGGGGGNGFLGGKGGEGGSDGGFIGGDGGNSGGQNLNGDNGKDGGSSLFIGNQGGGGGGGGGGAPGWLRAENDSNAGYCVIYRL